MQVSNVPVGCVLIWLRSTAPDGWVLCDGRALSTITYANLFSVISGTFGAGPGGPSSNTFRVPDYRAAFLRGSGTNGTENRYSGGSITGFPQYDTIKSHNHQYTRSYYTLSFNIMRILRSITSYLSFNITQGDVVENNLSINNNDSTHEMTTDTGDTETKPFSYSVNYIIKY